MDKGMPPICAKCTTKACDPIISATEKPTLTVVFP